VRDQVFNEVERRRIKPLQIVEEQRERVLDPRSPDMVLRQFAMLSRARSSPCLRNCVYR
jgi:hypothetical protein